MPKYSIRAEARLATLAPSVVPQSAYRDNPRTATVAAYKRRLRRLVRIRREHADEYNVAGLLWLQKAIFATYAALCDLGERETADDALRCVPGWLRR